MKLINHGYLVVALCCALVLGTAGCATRYAHNDDGLYQALGGQEQIGLMVNRFLNRVAEDKRILHYFYGVDISLLEQRLTQYLAVIAGGPVVYEGEELGLVHGGHYITEAAFNAVVENMQDAMEEVGMPLAARNELVARLAPLQGRIVSYRHVGH